VSQASLVGWRGETRANQSLICRWSLGQGLWDEFAPRPEELYQKTDAAYREVADQTRFSCGGCDGVTCCTIHLTLRTHAEKPYLKSGFNTLDAFTRREILDRCNDELKAGEGDRFSAAYRNAVCVLKIGGKCSMYRYRPMVRRLAGIPHFFLRPDGGIVQGAGCTRQRSDLQPVFPGLKIDRTPFFSRDGFN